MEGAPVMQTQFTHRCSGSASSSLPWEPWQQMFFKQYIVIARTWLLAQLEAFLLHENTSDHKPGLFTINPYLTAGLSLYQM